MLTGSGALWSGGNACRRRLIGAAPGPAARPASRAAAEPAPSSVEMPIARRPAPRMSIAAAIVIDGHRAQVPDAEDLAGQAALAAGEDEAAAAKVLAQAGPLDAVRDAAPT